MASETILTLVRHGETPANLDGVWHGATDTPLTERGHAQAQAVAGFLRERFDDVSALYSSHLQRARHTAAAIGEALSLELRVDAALGEFDLGGWEGKTYAELFETHRLWDHMKRDPHFAPHGGESPLGATRRVRGALEQIAHSHAGERVVVVTHGGALSMVLADLLDGDYSQWKRVMSNCAVSEVVLTPPTLVSFNHTAHLDGI